MSKHLCELLTESLLGPERKHLKSKRLKEPKLPYELDLIASDSTDMFCRPSNSHSLIAEDNVYIQGEKEIDRRHF